MRSFDGCPVIYSLTTYDLFFSPISAAAKGLSGSILSSLRGRDS
ncbi:hypothetical protein C357_11589 [Citreicella sp. 357]|nr:hypothetical protein C357_11589 [Citreicella sp. 357]